MGLSFPNIFNHSAQFRRWTLTLRKVVQILEHRFLPSIVELVLTLVLEVVDLLLICQGLLKLHLLLHFLLLIGQYWMFTRGALWVVDRIAGDGVHLVLLGRILV